MPYPLTLPAGGKDLGAGFLAGGVSPQEHGIGGLRLDNRCGETRENA